VTDVFLNQAFRPPVWDGGTISHVFGTDQLGRDLLQRLAYGARVSLLVGLASTIVASLIGVTIGLLAGYVGGWLDAVLARVADAQLCFPAILLGLSFAAFLPPSLYVIVLAIALSTWPMYTRVVRAEVLVVRQSDFVALAIAGGMRRGAIMRRHILPNVLPIVVVLASQNFGLAVIYEAALSYLGVGVQPPGTSLGLMISDGQVYLTSNPWVVFAPVIVLASISLAVNVLGDRLRDVFDPTSRTTA
jgi:peptide/nickel transport system permease protein